MVWGPVPENRPNKDEIKKAPPLLQQSSTVRKFPYRYFMERKSFDAPSLLWSEVRWKKGKEKREKEGKKEGEAGCSYFYIMGF